MQKEPQGQQLFLQYWIWICHGHGHGHDLSLFPWSVLVVFDLQMWQMQKEPQGQQLFLQYWIWICHGHGHGHDLSLFPWSVLVVFDLQVTPGRSRAIQLGDRNARSCTSGIAAPSSSNGILMFANTT
ncbi:hypothetical protein EOD39_13787 [Acipenser ruthenus]|uniref:Uncharacterized protein n=1 Tax=Acipenser ruthenus TaxID=7906 RepID=A0A662YMZ5_ACIRT|nr:hypothetical protein EOD39_13787 [Acipenser ruthenus]